MYSRWRHGTDELGALLHRGERVAAAEQQLLDFFRDLLEDVAATGALRTEVPPEELAKCCIHALAAASSLPSEAATRRLVGVTLDGLRRPPSERRSPRVRGRARH
jgi:hypothetical protein